MRYTKKIILLFIFILQLSCNNKTTPENETSESEIPVENEETTFYKGTTMGFVSHQEINGNVVFKENNVAKDPFESIKDHGGNIVRFRIDLPPYKSDRTVGYADVDFRSSENVKEGMLRAKNAGLETLLTFSYSSMALNPDQKLNNYVVPLNWQPFANDLLELKEVVYNHTYDILEEYVEASLIPKIISVGNEISWRFLEENKLENELLPYDGSRVAALLNSAKPVLLHINCPL